MNLVQELRWRGMIQDIMPGTEDQLQKEMTTGYIGFDPTADSPHIGNLVPILMSCFIYSGLAISPSHWWTVHRYGR
jgi:tyrosyl-tRNA synthetase